MSNKKPSYWRKAETNDYACSTAACSDAIIVQDLEKQFKTCGRNILIADRLNMVIKNKRITVLLGHNGAGKTTTINMIMGNKLICHFPFNIFLQLIFLCFWRFISFLGLVPKDSGKIVVCSERDASYYRHLIGYCPQHNIYMQYMTCKQHLVFFAKVNCTCIMIDLSLKAKYESNMN